MSEFQANWVKIRNKYLNRFAVKNAPVKAVVISFRLRRSLSGATAKQGA